MLLDIIIIVLRETLEAGVLISILLSISAQRNIGVLWLVLAFTLGVVGAVVYAENLGSISGWFEFVGQEVVNAFLQYAIYCSLVFICILRRKNSSTNYLNLKLLMGVAVSLIIVREGAELFVFYSSFIQGGENWIKAATSGFIGLLIGASVGALCFYSLITASANIARIVQQAILSLVAGGMVLQATQLLMQADWLTSSIPIWDSSWLLSESSVIGQLAYAIFGYEATPSLLELCAYLIAVFIITIASLIPRNTYSHNMKPLR